MPNLAQLLCFPRLRPAGAGAAATAPQHSPLAMVKQFRRIRK